MAVIPVAIAGAPYDVVIEEGALARAGALCRPFLRKDTVAVVTDENVAGAWRETVAASFAAQGIASHWLVPAGEATKSWENLARVVDWLLHLEVERKDNIVALGGGVIGDLTGFAASMVKRGCGFIQMPTTLLAQVDSSVGGKTAINTPWARTWSARSTSPAWCWPIRSASIRCPARCARRLCRSGEVWPDRRSGILLLVRSQRAAPARRRPMRANMPSPAAWRPRRGS
jgi:hypothetical protein